MKTHALISITCCLCGEDIDPNGWYATYGDDNHAHSACWQRAAKVNHNVKLQKSKFVFLKEEPEALFI